MSNSLYRNVIKVYQTITRPLRLQLMAKYSIQLRSFEEKRYKTAMYNCHVYKKYPLQQRNCSSLRDSLYEKICRETLESLTEFFEELQEEHAEFSNADISYNDGVLTINLGKKFGIYVINRQLPNKQIWLSSPISGPKRYDYENDSWIYKHNNQTLHSLLQEELSELLRKRIDLSQCLHFKR